MTEAMTQFTMWLKWYPGDLDGAIAAASDFIDNESDLDEFVAEFKAIEKAMAA